MPMVIVVVQSIADDESVGNREAAVVGFKRNYLSAFLAQENGDLDGRCP